MALLSLRSSAFWPCRNLRAKSADLKSRINQVREAFRRLTGQGWTDALRTLHPHERIYTFWKYFRNAFARDAGLRIDHLLLSRPVAYRLVGAGVDRAVRGREHTSDHAPAWIEIADTKSGPPRRGRRVAPR